MDASGCNILTVSEFSQGSQVLLKDVILLPRENAKIVTVNPDKTEELKRNYSGFVHRNMCGDHYCKLFTAHGCGASAAPLCFSSG